MLVKELAHRTGIPKQTLDKYLLTNGSMPPADKAVVIACALGVSVEYLVTGRKPAEGKTWNQFLSPELRSIADCVEPLPREQRKLVEDAVAELIGLLQRPWVKNLWPSLRSRRSFYGCSGNSALDRPPAGNSLAIVINRKNRHFAVNRLHALFVSRGIKTAVKKDLAKAAGRAEMVKVLDGLEREEADYLADCLGCMKNGLWLSMAGWMKKHATPCRICQVNALRARLLGAHCSGKSLRAGVLIRGIAGAAAGRICRSTPLRARLP
jgi:transcriptional regulator with XRE-family HTH domain